MSDERGFRDTVRLVVRHGLLILRSAFEVLTDRNIAGSILELAGIGEDPPAAGPVPDLAALTGIEAFADSDGAATVADLIALIDNIDQAVQPLRTWLAALSIGTDDQKVRETLLLLLQIFAYLTLKRAYPRQLELIKASGMLKDGLPDYEAMSFAKEWFKEFWRGEVTGDPARAAFILLSIGAELLRGKAPYTIEMLSGWEPPDPSPTPVADAISDRALTLGLENEGFDDEGGGRAQLGLVWVSGDHQEGIGPGLMFSLGGAVHGVAPMGPLLLDYQIEAAAPATFFVGPGGEAEGNRDARSVLTLRRDPDLAPERPTFNFGASYLSIGHMSVQHVVAAEKIDVTVAFSDTDLLLREAEKGGFLNSILPEQGLSARFTLGLKIDLIRGTVAFSEGTSMRAVLPIGGDGLRGVRVSYVTIDLADDPEKEGLETVNEISATATIDWGSLSVSIERMGVQVFLPGRSDRAGLSRYVAFKPPTGAGFVLDAKGVKGGGYLFYDADQSEWGGVVNLVIKKAVSLTALGLIKEGLPAAPNDFALVVMGSAMWEPGLGPLFGISLNGLGVIYAHNRTIDVDYLRQGVKTGLIDRVLFPDNPVGNAPQILNDMRRLFPIAHTRRAFAALLLLTFGRGNAARLKVGVAYDWPHPNTLAIVGSLAIKLPNFESEKPTAQILADFAIIWDEAARFVTIDAALRDSFLTDGLTLSGEMALRWHYGEDGVFVLSMGGFHPGFNASAELPVRAQMPQLERLTLALGTGSNPRIRALCYFAITPNSVQGGLRAELTAHKAGFTLDGWISGDALFDRDTNQIVIEFSAGVSIRRGTRVLFTLTLEARFEGFRPISFSGRVKFKILFVTVKIPVTFNRGAESSDRWIDIDLGPELVERLSRDSAWGEARPNASVQIATLGLGNPTPRQALLPSAVPSVRQGLAPLGLQLERLDGARLSGERCFAITEFLINGRDPGTRPIEDSFSPGQFFNLSDDERLSRPSFERYASGVQATDDGFETGPGLEADLRYETIVVDKRTDRRRRLGDFLIDRSTLFAALPFAAAASPRPQPEDRFPFAPDPVGLDDGGYVVVTTSDLRLADALTATPVSHATAREALARHLRDHPDHAGRLQVVERIRVAAGV